MKKILLAVSVLALLCAVTHRAEAGGTSGYNNGYYYFTYYTGNGTASISFPAGSSLPGNWRGTWTAGITDALTGKGWWPGSVRNVGYNCGQLSGSWHLFACYGWAPYPNREYYITEKGSNSGTYKGTVNSDGGTYTVYLQVVSSTFHQYKNDRQSDVPLLSNRRITMSNHVNKWKSLGWYWGTVRETVMTSEAFSGPGTVNATVWGL